MRGIWHTKSGKTCLQTGLIFLSSLTIHTAHAACDEYLIDSTQHLHWSVPSITVPAHGHWQIAVYPDFQSDDNQSPVVLSECPSGQSRTLFFLERNANVYWEPNGEQLLFINQPVANTSELLWFNTQTKPNANPRQMDQILRRATQKRLGKKSHIAFYLLDMVSWQNDQLVLSVGGAYLQKPVGAMTTYCFGIQLHPTTLKIGRVFSPAELKRRFNGAECRTSP